MPHTLTWTHGEVPVPNLVEWRNCQCPSGCGLPHTAGRITPYCYSARSRHTGKADDDNTAHDGIRSRILSMRRQRIYPIDNRHLPVYHGFLNCPHTILRRSKITQGELHDKLTNGNVHANRTLLTLVMAR
jgi:hypothetical protein